MWSTIANKHKPPKLPKITKKKEAVIQESIFTMDEEDYFDLKYYGQLEPCINELLNVIQNGPVFRYGNCYDIIDYIKSNCNLIALNSDNEEDDEPIVDNDDTIY